MQGTAKETRMMNKGRRSLNIHFLLSLMLFCGVMAERDAVAQNFSGLQGRELERERDHESAVGSLVDKALGNKNAQGNIHKVIVTGDAERRLVLTVRYSQLDGKVLWGELQDRDNKPQAQILTNSVVIKKGTTQAELVFRLDERLPQETALESGLLKLYVAKDLRSGASATLTYKIAKRWQMEIKPENQVIVITPQPIEEAARLFGQP
jgi:hypothetical protein